VCVKEKWEESKTKFYVNYSLIFFEYENWCLEILRKVEIWCSLLSFSAFNLKKPNSRNKKFKGPVSVLRLKETSSSVNNKRLLRNLWFICLKLPWRILASHYFVGQTFTKMKHPHFCTANVVQFAIEKVKLFITKKSFLFHLVQTFWAKQTW